jgi:RNA polymerase sigma factor (sigma-70 family)
MAIYDGNCILNEPPRPTALAARSDAHLVQACLEGDETAWSALIDRYKNLIFSVPIKYGFSRDEAADVFQMVCLELLSELSRIREPKALPKWLLMVAAHKCYHLRNHDRRRQEKNASFAETVETALPPEGEAIVREAENEQKIREAIASLPPRCQKLVRMLFFEEPARPYDEVAQVLGLARGSVGFIRQRCLEQLKQRLDGIGWGAHKRSYGAR